MLTRQECERREQEILAPYAALSGNSLGREHAEPEHPYRTAFQRDRDRIIHSNAFRRLEYKTQVFVYHEGDHYRTRLTHSMEGAQIGRTLARALRLNEDLAEAIILAHDLGHTPFGHSGEHVMDRLMKDYGGFEHNRQSLRIVTLLEDRYPNFRGLNLSYEMREGIAKHSTSFDVPSKTGFHKYRNPSLEAQIANLADEIAYCNHDLDDGLSSGLITLQQLQAIPLWQEMLEQQHAALPTGCADKILWRQTVKALINLLVTDLVTSTEAHLHGVKTLEEVRGANEKLVSLSDPVLRRLKLLKKFLYENMYRHPRVERMADKAGRILEDLFRTYRKNPRILPQEIFLRTEQAEPERHICDYIAGMTDRFALDEHKKLFDPHEKV